MFRYCLKDGEVRRAKYFSSVFAVLRDSVPGFSHIETNAYTNPLLYSGLTLRLIVVVNGGNPLYLWVGRHLLAVERFAYYDRRGCKVSQVELAERIVSGTLING